MINLSKQYVTRDGCEVELFTIKEDQEFPVLGIHRTASGRWLLASWDMHGLFTHAEKHALDLIEVKPEIVVWINEYWDAINTYWEKEKAKQYAGADRIALHRVVLNDDTRVEEDD